MLVYLKSFKVQIYMFIAFFIIGINLIIQELWGKDHSWVFLITLALIVGVLVVALLVYRRSAQTTIEISNKELLGTRILLYAYFGVYVLQMLLGTIDAIKTNPDHKTLLVLISGGLLMAIALAGMVLQMLILKRREHCLFKAE